MGYEGAETSAKDPEFLSTLERGLRVLKAFDEDHPEMTLSEVAAKTALPPAVARRCPQKRCLTGYVVNMIASSFAPRATIRSAFSCLDCISYMSCLASFSVPARPDRRSAPPACCRAQRIPFMSRMSLPTAAFAVAANVARDFPSMPRRLGNAFAANLPESELLPLLRPRRFSVSQRTVRKAPAGQALALGRDPGYRFGARRSLVICIVSVACRFGRDRRAKLRHIILSTSTTRYLSGTNCPHTLPLLRGAGRRDQPALRRWPCAR